MPGPPPTNLEESWDAMPDDIDHEIAERDRNLSGNWEEPPDTEPDYETRERDELALDDEREPELPEGHVWCTACGAATPESLSTCNHCGGDWHQYCHVCGLPIVEDGHSHRIE